MSEVIVPENWKIDPLKKMCDFYVPMRDKPTEFDGDIPWLKIDEINEKFTNGFNAKHRVSEKIIKEMKLRVYPIGTVLFSCSASIGTCSITTAKLTTNQTFIGIFPKTEIFNEFLYYFLKANVRKLAELGKGTTISYIPRKKFENFQIPYPDLEIQKQIVAKLDHILGQLGEKKKQILTIIENNKQRIDFFEKNWLSYVIDREIEHHPDRKNWELKQIDSFARVGQGGTPSRSMPQYWNGDIPWLSSGELRNNEIIDSNEKITQLGLDHSSTQLCPKGTVLIAMTGQGLTRGRTALLKIEACANQSCAHMIVKEEEIIPEYLWLYLQGQYWKIRSIHHGSGQPGINTTMIKSWKVPIPSLNIQKQIIQKIKSAEEKFQSQKQQFQNIKNSYESTIKYIEHMQSSILDAAFSGKLVQ